jgi:ubiquinone/menaquinone biosynthesis C-methylase UbiE
VDASRALLDIARDRSKLLDTSGAPVPVYHFGDARSMPFLKSDTFDLAVCIFAIQNIDPIQPVFTEVARVLRPGGRFVVVMMHPCFRSIKESHWGWDQEKRVQYRRVDRYLLPRKHPIVAHPGVKNSPYTWTFHKPLEDYVKSGANAGLLVDSLQEWASHKQSLSGARSIAENLSRLEIPMFLALRFIKP